MQPDFYTKILQELAMQGPVVSVLALVVFLLVRVIKQQYADARADRAELLAAYKAVGDSVNNLAKQLEIQNALQKTSK